MPRAKKPVAAKIVADGDNLAVYFGKSTLGQPSDGVVCGLRIGRTEPLAAGIRSLMAERDMLRGLVLEAFGAQQDSREELPLEELWRLSRFPAKIERPWDV